MHPKNMHCAPTRILIGHESQARAVGRAGTLGEEVDTVLGCLTVYWNGQGHGLRVRKLLHIS